MHGLRTSARNPGWTRLCDEWVIGLDRFVAREAGFGDELSIVRCVADAAERVRRFARGGDTVPPLAPDAEGLLRFELQGYDYVVAVRRVAVTTAAPLATVVPAALEAAMAQATRSLAGDQVAAAVVVVVYEGVPLDSTSASALVDAALALSTAALAWAVPEAGDPLSPGDVGARPPLLFFANL